MLAEERRLFYVACTRARQRLVVTAVQSPDDDGEQPSRFLHELGREPDAPGRAGRGGRSRWPAWSPSCAAPSPTPTQPEPLRAAAARRLAAARRRPTSTAGRSRRSADPATWWGLRAPHAGRDQPVAARRRAGHPVGQRARGPAHLPGAVVPRARGRRRGGQLHQPGLRQGRARDRRADRQGRARPTTRRPDGPRRRGLGPAGVPHPVVARPRARGGRGGAGPVRGLAPPARRPHRRRHRAEDAGRGDPARRRRWSGCTGTPTGSSSTRTAASWSSTSRPASTRPPDKELPSTPAARPLPARRRPRRRRRARRPAGRARAAPSWSSCGIGDDGCPRCSTSRRRGRRRRRTPGRGAADAGRGARSAPRSSWPGPGTHCDRCTFQAICPDKAAGTVLS